MLTHETIDENDDPAPTGSLTINDQFLDDYNEESDQDWDAGNGSDSDGSIDQGILSHPAFHMDDDSLGDVDVDGPEEESQLQLCKFYLFIYNLFYLYIWRIAWEPFTEEEMEKLREEAREKGLMKFVEKYMIQESTPVAKMLEPFGIFMVCISTNWISL